MHKALIIKRLGLSSSADHSQDRLLFPAFELNSDLEYETSDFVSQQLGRSRKPERARVR